jgi:hypothetical protein
MGSLPAYKSSYQNGSKKRYGSNGNSFVCSWILKVKAKSLLAGGNSGNTTIETFYDQAEMYQKVNSDVLFYKEDILKHMKKIYHPGE